MKSILAPMIALALVLASTASAESVKMPNEIEVAGKKLVLNGIGMRLATLFKVKVYAAGLYLEKRSKNADEILSSPEVKRVHLHFLRDVKQEQVRDAWKESFEKNCKAGCEGLKPAMDKFLALITAEKEGDTLDYTILPGKVEVARSGTKAGEIDDARFGVLVLQTWLGPNPPNSEVKEGMLGRTGE